MNSILDALQKDLAPKQANDDAQSTCIDLPGETVRCWRRGDKIKVVLRKHRDVIIEINQQSGTSYTVHATESPFYNARDKKLVEPGLRHAVTFRDGELLHLWVGREFKGELLVSANGFVFGRYEPNHIDPYRYGADAAAKPAPLIVMLGMHNALTSLLPAQPSAVSATPGLCTADNPSGGPTNQSYSDLFVQAAPKQETKSMHVVEVHSDSPGVPKEIVEYFKHGGEETAIDASGLLTRNWLWAQITGGAAYVSDNLPWIRELWRQKFYLQKVTHKVGTRWYIVFKGSVALRKHLTAARYGVLNPKVIAISAGAGTAAGLRHAGWEAAKGSVKKAGALAVIFTIALDTAEWLGDYEQHDPKTGKPKRNFFDLTAKIGIDLAKAGISAALGAAAVGLLVGVVVVAGGLAAGTAGAVAFVIVGTIVAAVIVGAGLDWLDKRIGVTDKVANGMRKAAEHLKDRQTSDYDGYPESLLSIAP